jgi:hypothetical protein
VNEFSGAGTCRCCGPHECPNNDHCERWALEPEKYRAYSAWLSEQLRHRLAERAYINREWFAKRLQLRMTSAT